MVPGKQQATLSSGLVSSSSYPCGCALSYTRRASSRFASIRFRSTLRRQDKARSLRSFVSTADAYAMPTNLPAVVTIMSSNFTPTQRRATKLTPLPLSQAASGLARLDQAQGEVHVWLVFRRGPSDTDEMGMDAHVRPGEVRVRQPQQSRYRPREPGLHDAGQRRPGFPATPTSQRRSRRLLRAIGPCLGRDRSVPTPPGRQCEHAGESLVDRAIGLGPTAARLGHPTSLAEEFFVRRSPSFDADDSTGH